MLKYKPVEVYGGHGGKSPRTVDKVCGGGELSASRFGFFLL